MNWVGVIHNSKSSRLLVANPGAAVDGHGGHRRHSKCNPAGSVDRYDRPCTALPVGVEVAFGHVAVRTGGHAALEGGLSLLVLAGFDDKTPVAPPQGYGVVAVSPPVGDLAAEGCVVAKANHAGDVGPTVLAYPTPLPAVGHAVRVNSRSAPVSVGGRTLVRVSEVIAGHDLRVAVGPCQHIDVRQVVKLTILEGQDIASRPVAALVVVIVGEDNGLVARQEDRGRAELFEVG